MKSLQFFLASHWLAENRRAFRPEKKTGPEKEERSHPPNLACKKFSCPSQSLDFTSSFLTLPIAQDIPEPLAPASLLGSEQKKVKRRLSTAAAGPSWAIVKGLAFNTGGSICLVLFSMRTVADALAWAALKPWG